MNAHGELRAAREARNQQILVGARFVLATLGVTRDGLLYRFVMQELQAFIRDADQCSDAVAMPLAPASHNKLAQAKKRGTRPA